jgi:hypothetical protein
MYYLPPTFPHDVDVAGNTVQVGIYLLERAKTVLADCVTSINTDRQEILGK